MRRAALALVPLLLGLAAAWGDDAKDKPKTDTPAEAYKALVEEYSKAQQEYLKSIRAAKTNEERQEAFKKYPQPSSYSARFLEIATKNPKDPVAVDALIWVARNDGRAAEGNQALEILAKDHLDNPKVAQLAPSLARSQSPHAEKILRAGYDKGESKEAKGQAAFTLAQYLANQAQPRNGKVDEAKLQEAEKLFEIVTKEYADVKSPRGTLGDTAAANLFEIRNLSIGKSVPEIEGPDTDGKTFKLSDYRGKVVLLDFWGHW